MDIRPLGKTGLVASTLGLALSQHPNGRSVETSRERLNLDRIPIVQIHEIRTEIWDAVIAPTGALAALRKLRATVSPCGQRRFSIARSIPPSPWSSRAPIRPSRSIR